MRYLSSGPIELGKDARVGSNAVVLSNVKDDGTVVGVPGRQVDSKMRLNVARYVILPFFASESSSVGFDVADMKKHMPDPMAKVCGFSSSLY